jgi:hypothetical protein
MSQELLGKLRLLEWKCRDRWERAEAAQKDAHESEGRLALPHTQNEMDQFEIDMLRAQCDLARAEDEAADDEPCPTQPVNMLSTTILLSGSFYPTEGTELKLGADLQPGTYSVVFTPITPPAEKKP